MAAGTPAVTLSPHVHAHAIAAISASEGAATVAIDIDARANAEMPSGFEVYVAGGRTPTGKDMRYRADFTFRRDGRRVVVDAKGHKTDTYLMKKAILSAQGIEIHEYTAKGGLKP